MGCFGEQDEVTAEEKIYKRKFENTKKLLLLGTGESGKTTIIKQMKIIHINGFNDIEKREKIPYIRKNIHESIYEILNNMDKLDPPIQCETDEAKTAAESILQVGQNAPTQFTEDYYNNVKLAWADKGVQDAYKRSNEYQLIDCAKYFLDRLDDIKQSTYLPNVDDILQCRIMTNGISKIEFSIKVSAREGGGIADFWMFDVGGQRGERRKWFRVFEEQIDAILFLIAASDFDLKLREDNEKNRLKEAIELFQNIYQNPYLQSAGLIVFLNKVDLLEKKIQEGHKFEQEFPEFADYKPSETDYDSSYSMKAKYFMRQKILDISNIPVTIDEIVLGKLIKKKLPKRDVHVHFTVATDTNNIKKVFQSVQEMILKNTLGVVLF